MITIKEISEMAGVSTTTVSNVIHGKTKKVSRENIEKIQKLLTAHHYVTPLGLSALTNKHSKIIGVVIHETKHYGESLIADPFYSLVIGAIEVRLKQEGYYMMLYASEDLNDIFKMAVAWNVDGLICLSFTQNDYNKIGSLTKKPVVAVDIYNSAEGECVNIGLQDEEGGYLMTKHLIESGFEKILVLALQDVGVDHDRYMGYRRALKEYGIPYKKEYFIPLYDEEDKRASNYKRLCRFMGKGYAMFFFSDWYAVEAMNYFQGKGYLIPEEVSIAGFDDMFFAKICNPPLTTIQQEPGKKGQMAVTMMMKLLAGEKITVSNIKLPVKLAKRKSVCYR